MKFECAECRHVGESADVVAHGTTLSLRCSRCGAATPVQTLPRKKPSEGPVECPKCGFRQADPLACERCGLVFEKWDPSAAAPDPDEDVAWRRVLTEWDRASAHDAYLAFVGDRGLLGAAAGRYRSLIDDPERGAEARRRIQRIVALAEQALTATTKPTSPRTLRRAITLVGLAICLALLWLMFSALTR